MRYKLLGSIEVERDGGDVAVGGPQQRRLLGLLVSARGGTVSADRLVDALWPDGDAPDGAARSVMTYVSRLRTAVGDGHIVTQGSGYRLMRDRATWDVDEFEDLVSEAEASLPDRAIECYGSALGLWHGDVAFGEFAGEWWAVAEATRLAELRVVAREEHAGALMAIGHHGRAVPALEGLVVEHPLRERPVSLLMHALVATGRQADALRAYRSYRTRLAEATGLDPSADLLRLERTIAGGLEPGVDGSLDRPLRGYVIHEAIGEGSFGRVYSATQPGTERRVAIKVIRPDLADSAEFIRRFDAEARIVARLEHPHIVPLYDYWRQPGGAYLVFRYLAGGTARDSVVSGGAWSVQRVSQLVEEIGGALIAAHAAGVEHHDIKSSNVMLDDRGAAYLTDFGIAVSHDPTPPVSTCSRDDVRRFGSMLWELLTGNTAGGGTSVSTAQSLNGQVVAAGGIDAVLAKATAPDGGYATVAELVLGWRAAVGRPEGVLSPVTSDERRVVDEARRSAARQLAQTAAAGVNPFKGLRPFDEADAAAFFGRDTVIGELEAAVARRRFVTIVGASGSGKSSVVRAGLVPRLRSTGHTVVTMVPGDDPVAALRQALSEVSSRRGRAHDPAAMIDHVVAACGPLVVIVDQFEECWTRADPDRRAEFLDVVAGRLDGCRDVCVVATIRADTLDGPLQEPRLRERIGAGAVVLTALSPAQLGDAITLPAAHAGVTVDEAVVADLVTEASVQPGSLPLLQFTLAELYDRRVDGRIGAGALAAIGGVAGSIGRRAEEVYLALDEPAREHTRTLFSRLVTPGDRIPDTRRRAGVSELSEFGWAVAQRYVAARLLVTDRDPVSREPTVEVAHEALLSGWPRLAEWIDADRRWLTQLHHLAAASRAWDERERPEADLYRGTRLEAAVDALDNDGRAVSAVEREYVEAGRAARDRELHAAHRSARRLRRLLVGVGAMLVVALVAGSLALAAQRRADGERDRANAAADLAEQREREAESAGAAEAAARQEAEAASEAESDARQQAEAERDRAQVDRLVAESERAIDQRLDRALLLAVEARRRDDSVDTRGAVLTALTQVLPGAEVAYPLDAPVASSLHGFIPTDLRVMHGAEISADGRTVVVNGEAESGAAVFAAFDVETRTERRRVELDQEILDVGVDRVGTRALVATAEAVEIYGLASDSRLGIVAVQPQQPNVVEASLSPDAATVGVIFDDGSVRFFDAATGNQLAGAVPPPIAGGGRFGPEGSFIFGAVSPDTGHLALHFWDVHNGRDTRTVDLVPPAELGSYSRELLLSPDMKLLVGINDPSGIVGSVDVWDATTGQLIGDRSQRPAWARSLPAFVSDRVVALGRFDGQIVLYDLATEQVARRPLETSGGGIRALAATPDGRTLVSAGDEGLIRIWGADDRGLIDRPLAAGRQLQGASADGTRIAVQPAGGTAEVVTVDGSAAPIAITTPDGFMHGHDGVSMSADGARVMVMGRMPEGRGGFVADARTGETLWASGPTGDWFQARISADGTRVVALVEDGSLLRSYDVATGDVVAETTEQRIGRNLRDGSLNPSRDGRFVDVIAGEGVARLDADTLELVSYVNAGGVLQWDVADVPGTDDVLATGFRGQLYRLNMATGEVRIGRSRDITSLAGVGLSPDGSVVAANQGFTSSIALFDAETLQPIGRPIPAGEANASPRFTANGDLVANSRFGVSVWEMDPDEWDHIACHTAARNLTRAEWDEYLGDEPYRVTCAQWSPAPR